MVFGLLLERPAAILGVQEARPEARVADELLRPVAEDLLDLRADVAPAAMFAQLGGVDDDRELLDQAAEVVAACGELIEESFYLVLWPVPIGGGGAPPPLLSPRRRGVNKERR